MTIACSAKKDFAARELEDLFFSVEWPSRHFSEWSKWHFSI